MEQLHCLPVFRQLSFLWQDAHRTPGIILIAASSSNIPRSVNMEKSTLTQTQTIECIGATLDSLRVRASLPMNRVHDMSNLIDQVCVTLKHQFRFDFLSWGAWHHVLPSHHLPNSTAVAYPLNSIYTKHTQHEHHR